MRKLLCTALPLLFIGAIVANAEPPPQAAVEQAPAITVADAQTNALPAIMVRQVDSTATTAASPGSTEVRVDTGAGVQADKKDGHGLGFWAVIVVIVLAVGFVAYRYFTRQPEPTVVPTSRAETDELGRTRGPGKSGRRSDADL